MRVTTDAVDEFGCGSADELDLMGIEAVEGAGHGTVGVVDLERGSGCLLYTSPSPRDS